MLTSELQGFRRAKEQELNMQITRIISEFEQETGLQVQDISLQFIPMVLISSPVPRNVFQGSHIKVSV